MKLREFLEVVNYDDFAICTDTDKGLKNIFKINKNTPIKYIAEELLNSKVSSIFIDDEYKDNENDLFCIEIKLGDE